MANPSNDKLRVYVPNGNVNAAEIEINGERPAVSRLEIILQPNELPTVRVELCPNELDLTIDAEPAYSLAKFTEEAHKATRFTGIDFAKPGSDRTVLTEIRADRKPAKPIITGVTAEKGAEVNSAGEVKARIEAARPRVKALQRIVSQALADSIFKRIEREGGKSFLDNLRLFNLRMDDAKGYDPYNRCPA